MDFKGTLDVALQDKDSQRQKTSPFKFYSQTSIQTQRGAFGNLFLWRPPSTEKLLVSDYSYANCMHNACI